MRRRFHELMKRNVELRLERLSWSQSELARRSEIPQPNLSAYLSGKIVPGIDKVEAIAEALGAELHELLEPNPKDLAEQPWTRVPGDLVELISRASPEALHAAVALLSGFADEKERKLEREKARLHASEDDEDPRKKRRK